MQDQAGRQPIEIRFAEEPRIGQKNKITRGWAKRGTCLSTPRDLRIASIYIFGAISSARGKAAGPVQPRGMTQAMNEHLKEMAQAVTPGAHAVLLLDQAGRHVQRKLKVPAKASKPNPVQNIWQYMPKNWISNRVFAHYSDILDHCDA